MDNDYFRCSQVLRSHSNLHWIDFPQFNGPVRKAYGVKAV
jgi:hypothetical protein